MKRKILVVPSDKHGVGFFRSLNPHISLEKMYGEDFHVDIDYQPNLEDDEYLASYDLIHYHRTLGPYENMEELLNKLDKLGTASVMDIDDHWAPGPHHPLHNLIKSSGLDKKIINNIKLARNVITTTEIFAEEIRKYNKNVFVIANGIDETEQQYIPKETKSEKIRIGWLGGSSHFEDLKLLRSLTTMLKGANLMDKVQFVLCGFDLNGKRRFRDANGETKERNIRPQESVWYEYEKIFTDNYKLITDTNYLNYLKTYSKVEYPGVENQPYRRVWTKPINSYATSYNLFDVSLAPLTENNFNKVKSQLKVIEAAFHKKVIIAQDFGPYQIDLINAIDKGAKGKEPSINKKGNAILIKNTKSAKEWFKAIKKIVNEPELFSQLRENLNKDITSKYSLKVLSKTRKDVYDKIIK